MTTGINELLDPSVCSCFSTSHHHLICNRLRWSTVSIATALLIIIVYASSGLYTLIDVTVMMSTHASMTETNETIVLPIFSSPGSIQLGWTSFSVYFAAALLVTLLLCGIQLRKPWLLFLWSILMIVMLLVDGTVTVLSLRQHQQQTYRPVKQVRILFYVMVTRLVVSLCGIFVTLFHFRCLSKAKSEYAERQRMLLRYNTESASPLYDSSWTRSTGPLVPSHGSSEDHFLTDLPSSTTLPRAKVATIQRHPTSSMFHSHQSFPSQLEYGDYPHRRSNSGYNEAFQYNVPSEDRFHQENHTGLQEL